MTRSLARWLAHRMIRRDALLLARGRAVPVRAWVVRLLVWGAS